VHEFGISLRCYIEIHLQQNMIYRCKSNRRRQANWHIKQLKTL